MRYIALILLVAAAAAASAQTGSPLNASVPFRSGPDGGHEGTGSWPMTVITADDIRRSTAVTVAEVVRGAVGIMLADKGTVGGPKIAGLHGAGPAQVLVLLDGVRMNSPRDGSADLSALPVTLNEVERIEVMRGPVAARYGIDAIGGVVNIVTRQPVPGGSSVLGGAWGSHGFDIINAGASGRHDASFYALSGGRMTADGIRENSDLDQWNANGKIGYDLTEGITIEISANYVSSEQGDPGPVDAGGALARRQQRQAMIAATYRQQVTSEVDLLLRTARIDDVLRYGDPGATGDEHISESDVSEARLSWRAGSWSFITLGYETRNDHLESSATGDHEATIDAWFLEDDVAVGDSFRIAAGQRYENHWLFGEERSTRASARYLLGGAGTALRVSFGESFRAPTFNELYWPSRPTEVGNPDLLPETAEEYGVGIEQSLGEGSVLNVTSFERKVENLIDRREIAPLQYRPENIDRVTVTGVEAEAVLRFSAVSSFGVNYAYLDPVDETTGERIYYAMPRDQVKGTLTMRVDQDVFITVEGRSVRNRVPPGDPEWKYSVVDAKISQEIGRKTGPKGELYFAMTNLFDRKFEHSRGYPMPPKEIRGGVTLLF